MHRATRVLLAFLTLAITATLTTVIGSSPANAATWVRKYGVITNAYQYRDGTISVEGYAFDRDHIRAPQPVCLVVDRRCVREIWPHYPSPTFDSYHHIIGPHRFHVYIRAQRPGAPLALRTHDAQMKTLDWAAVSTPGHRVVTVARKYVGRVRYSYGGSSPRTGFDCSGYAMYSYGRAHVAALPHSANAQRFHTRWIHGYNARPGDLVFYMSGSYAYHVAIYAGNGWQYSAADPAEGIKYQRISARNIQFRTNWH